MLFAITVVIGLAQAAEPTPVRFAADAALIGLSGGVGFYRYGQTTHAGRDVAAQVVRLGAGCELGNRLGIVVGASLAEADFLASSMLPVTARIYWDFTPAEHWRRAIAYVMATYNHTRSWGDDDYPLPPSLDIGAGVAYTFYAITPKMEFKLHPGGTSASTASLLIGLDIGGTYVFGPATAEPEE